MKRRRPNSAGPSRVPRGRRAPICGRQAGLTLLEVVISLVLLGMLSSMVFGAISFMQSAADYQLRRLDAVEVAHRVVMQHIDNRELLRGQPRRVEQNGRVFHFELREELLVQEESEGEGPTRRTAQRSDQSELTEILSQKLHQVTVDVYAEDEKTGKWGGEPLATIVRVFDPTVNLNGDDEAVLRWILSKLNEEKERRGGASAPSGSGAPAPQGSPGGNTGVRPR